MTDADLCTNNKGGFYAMLISGLAATFFYNAPFKTYIIISPLIGLFAAMIINKLKK